jgi:hypothetical protein
MMPRIRRAAFTFLGFAGLVLLGLLMFSLTTRNANAQRYSNASKEQPSQFPVVTAPAVVNTRNGFRNSSPQPDPVPIFRGYVSAQPIIVAIKEGPQLRGELVELGALQVKTIFGQVSIPLDRISGIRIADDPRQPATICLSNGDSLTGELATDALTIKTEWGSATIARDHIVSIVTSTEPVTWQQHEGRWRISPVEPQPREDETDDAKKQQGKVESQATPQPIEVAPSGTSTAPMDKTQ